MTASADIDPQTLLTRSDEVLYTEFGGDVTLMSVESGKYYSLREVGARIWALLERPTTTEQICNQLLVEYRVNQERCGEEVVRVIRQMASEGIVVRASAAA